jgi:hypothetical protein
MSGHSPEPFFTQGRTAMHEKKFKDTAESVGADGVPAALIERLARIRPVPARLRSPESMQVTPEAGRTRAARVGRKQRLMLQKAKHAAISQLTAVPPAPDPLMP